MFFLLLPYKVHVTSDLQENDRMMIWNGSLVNRSLVNVRLPAQTAVSFQFSHTFRINIYKCLLMRCPLKRNCFPETSQSTSWVFIYGHGLSSK